VNHDRFGVNAFVVIEKRFQILAAAIHEIAWFDED
jgi:hypothetical protein